MKTEEEIRKQIEMYRLSLELPSKTKMIYTINDVNRYVISALEWVLEIEEEEE